MEFKDKHNNPIQDGQALLFSHEDSVEPSGVSKQVTLAALCFYSKVENRWIPFSESMSDVDPLIEVEIVYNEMPNR